MNGRALALTILIVGALVSFGLAIWSASQGKAPIVETSHAVLFAFMGLLLATRDPEGSPNGCRECGRAVQASMAFCTHCGHYPKIQAAS